MPGEKGPAQKYARVLRYALRQGPALLVILAITLVGPAVTALQPWPLKILVDYGIGGAAVPTPVLAVLEALSLPAAPVVLIATAAAAQLGLFLLSAAADTGLTWAWAAAGQRMILDLAGDLFRQLQRLSLAFHSRRTVGDFLTRLTSDSWCVYRVTEGLAISPFRNVLTLATVGAVAWTLDPMLTALSLLFVPAAVSGAFFYGRRIKARARQHRDAGSRLAAFVQQTLAAVPVVQAFTREQRNCQDFLHGSADVVALSQRNAMLNQTFSLINTLATTAGVAVVLYVGGQRVLSGALSLGSLLVFIAYLRSIEGAMRGLLKTYVELKATEASIDRVLEVLDAEDTVRDAPGAISLPPRGRGERGRVSLEGVTVGYEPRRPVLQEVTLQLHPGETIALVGPTGAGKSTLAALIPRFLDPWRGRVVVDGCDVRQVRLASLRARIALVLQEPFLLPLSVAANLAYGRPDARREEIVAAAEAAHADAFIRQLPEGYDTVLGERGVSLSGGEKQRLAIARALVKDAPVLILDEPTAALDAETEALLMDALERLMAGRTTFIIAHRLSTIRKADRIVVLDEGRVVEAGSHRELLGARGGRYRRFHLLQGLEVPRGIPA